MKFICNQQVLSKALNIVSRAVSARTTIPILKGILIEAEENGTLRLSASDLDLSIEKTVEADVKEPGSIVVSAKLFGDIIRKLPHSDIDIEVNENNNVTIKSMNSEFNVVGISHDEFPSFGDSEEETEDIIFEKDAFTDMVNKTAFSASIDESKGVITGVLIELEEESTNMAALDGFRMAVTRKKINNDKKKKIVIDAKIIKELSKIISDSEYDGNIRLTVGKKKASALLPGTRIVMRLLEGEFIKYKDIIPKQSSIKVVLDRAELLESIQRASLLAIEGKNNLIRINIEDDRLTIRSRSEEGSVKEEMSVKKEGNDLEIGFNSKYLLDVIDRIDDEMILMEFNTNVNPCLVRPIEGNDYEYLILPVRINGSF